MFPQNKHSLIPWVINELKKLDFDTRGSASFNIFGQVLSRFIECMKRMIYSTYESVELWFLTRLQLGFRHLRGQNFKKVSQ